MYDRKLWSEEYHKIIFLDYLTALLIIWLIVILSQSCHAINNTSYFLYPFFLLPSQFSYFFACIDVESSGRVEKISWYSSTFCKFLYLFGIAGPTNMGHNIIG